MMHTRHDKHMRALTRAFNHARTLRRFLIASMLSSEPISLKIRDRGRNVKKKLQCLCAKQNISQLSVYSTNVDTQYALVIGNQMNTQAGMCAGDLGLLSVFSKILMCFG